MRIIFLQEYSQEVIEIPYTHGEDKLSTLKSNNKEQKNYNSRSFYYLLD